MWTEREEGRNGNVRSEGNEGEWKERSWGGGREDRAGGICLNNVKLLPTRL